ncbi:MAG: hypothetical protein WC635_02860 [Bacteriovorax sp.]
MSIFPIKVELIIHKLLFFVIIITVSQNSISAFAIDYSSPIKYDLSNAKIIAIGKLELDESGKEILVIKKQWTLSPQIVRMPERIKVVDIPKLSKIGEVYIYAALNETNKNGELKIGYTRLVNLNTDQAKIIFERLAKRNDFVGEVNPSWQFCEADSECTIQHNRCGNSIAVNKKYQKNYLDFIKTIKTKTDCTKVASETKSEIKCIENFCSLK